MASHGTVVDHRIGAGMKLRELDDSRRGARFSNRKEDKLLERKLTYLNNQNKRVQISINREKEFIKTRHPKENDKEMNHLDRRYKEAMGFILDYKTTSVLQEDQRRLSEQGKRVNQSALTKCRAYNRIRSAPSSAFNSTSDMRNKRHRPTKPRGSLHIREAWLGKRLSKMSIDSTSTSSTSELESDSEEEIFRPFSGRPRPKPGSAGTSSSSTVSDKRGEISSGKMGRIRGQPRSLHRINTSVIKNGFWSVLSHSRNTTVEKTCSDGQRRRPSLADTARDVLVEQRVVKFLNKVDQLKPKSEPLPSI